MTTTSQLVAFRADLVLPDPGGRRDRVVLVHDPARPRGVQVRWWLHRGPMWECAACGPQDHAHDCTHVFSAALLLAEHLLGLRHLPQLDATRSLDDDRN